MAHFVVVTPGWSLMQNFGGLQEPGKCFFSGSISFLKVSAVAEAVAV